LVVSSSSAVIAVGGAYGTLSEIALALRLDIPVIGVGTWALIRPDGTRDRGIRAVTDPSKAAAEAMRLAQSGR
jgi:predicted Rossmann-fold nucleotide-binding protein